MSKPILSATRFLVSVLFLQCLYSSCQKDIVVPQPTPSISTEVVSPERLPNDYNHLATMCGSYNWFNDDTKWETQFNAVAFTIQKGTNPPQSIYYGTPCVTFSRNYVFTKSQADIAWNYAWNTAVSQIITALNNGTLPPGDEFIRTSLTQHLSTIILNRYGGRINRVGCEGHVTTYSNPKWCIIPR